MRRRKPPKVRGKTLAAKPHEQHAHKTTKTTARLNPDPDITPTSQATPQDSTHTSPCVQRRKIQQKLQL